MSAIAFHRATLENPRDRSKRSPAVRKAERKETRKTHSSEEPPVLSLEVALLKELLDLLLRVLAARNLLERLGRDDALEALELESVASGEEVVVVDRLFRVRG